MINSVRNTVLFLLNKDNRGYIAPIEYNYFAKQAQLEIFEQYFSDYSKATQLQNARSTAIGYGDTVSQVQNKIDIFTVSSVLNYVDVDSAASGTTTGVQANKLIDSTQSFTSTVTVGDQVLNQVDGQTALVSGIDSNTTLSLDTDIMISGQGYTIDPSPGGEVDYFTLPSNLYKLVNITYKGKIVQGVPTSKFDMLSSSNLTAPSITYPIYKRNASNLFVRPLSIYYTDTTPKSTEPPLICNYIRKPVDPVWAYYTLNNDPVYNPDDSTNFEIPSSDEASLVIKICKLAGLSIRENDVVQAATAMEGMEYQKQNS